MHDNTHSYSKQHVFVFPRNYAFAHNCGMEIKDTLAAWMALKGTNPSRMAAATAGLNQPTIQRILSGETPDPRIGTLNKIASSLGITVEQLRSPPTEDEEIYEDAVREGKYLAKEAERLGLVSGDSFEPNSHTPPRAIVTFDNADELDDGQYLHLPAIKLQLSAGHGSIMWEVDRGKPRAFDRAFIAREGIDPKCAATMVVSGDSMSPTLRDGWSVLVDYCQPINLLDGRVYALVWQGEYFIKRIFKGPAGTLRLVSDNPDKTRYPDREIGAEHMEELSIIGRVDHIVGGRL